MGVSHKILKIISYSACKCGVAKFIPGYRFPPKVEMSLIFVGFGHLGISLQSFCACLVMIFGMLKVLYA